MAQKIPSWALNGVDGSGLTGTGVGANLIINGDMRIAQRGTSQTASGSFVTDRWKFLTSGAMAQTVSQDTDVPTGEGFTYSLKWDVTTADASLAAGDYAIIQYKIEGNDFEHLLYGSASAKQFTMSFWLKSDTKTGTMAVRFQNAANNRSYVQEITVSDNNWNQYSFTVSGDTTGTWATGTSTGLDVVIALAAGSTFQGTAGSWQGSNLLGSSSGDNFVDNVSNNIWITGCKIELGSTATDFVPDDYATALAKCQRYTRKSFPQGTAPAQSAGTSGCLIWPCPAPGASPHRYINQSFEQPMRATPTVTLYNPSAANAQARNITNTADGSSTSAVLISNRGFSVETVGDAGASAGVHAFGVHWLAVSEL